MACVTRRNQRSSNAHKRYGCNAAVPPLISPHIVCGLQELQTWDNAYIMLRNVAVENKTTIWEEFISFLYDGIIQGNTRTRSLTSDYVMRLSVYTSTRIIVIMLNLHRSTVVIGKSFNMAQLRGLKSDLIECARSGLTGPNQRLLLCCFRIYQYI